MLVISRRIGESFVIGDNIVATVIDITGEKVVLGVEAPKEVPIVRFEPAEGEERPHGNINTRGYARQHRKTREPSDNPSGDNT